MTVDGEKEIITRLEFLRREEGRKGSYQTVSRGTVPSEGGRGSRLF